jgi:hypothetical protein
LRVRASTRTVIVSLGIEHIVTRRDTVCFSNL